MKRKNKEKNRTFQTHMCWLWYQFFWILSKTDVLSNSNTRWLTLTANHFNKFHTFCISRLSETNVSIRYANEQQYPSLANFVFFCCWNTSPPFFTFSFHGNIRVERYSWQTLFIKTIKEPQKNNWTLCFERKWLCFFIDLFWRYLRIKLILIRSHTLKHRIYSTYRRIAWSSVYGL